MTPEPVTPQSVTPQPAATLRGRRIFLVEDETYVALLLEDMLDELDCVMVGAASCIEDGARMAETVEADVALLDVNVDGRDVFPIAKRLIQRRIPIVFATGYGAQGVPAEWRTHIIIRKPFLIEGVAAALNAALDGGRPARGS